MLQILHLLLIALLGLQEEDGTKNDWQVSEYPTRHELDSLFPNRPVAVRRIDGHALLANRVALELAGIFNFVKENGSQIEGGEIVLLADGTPSGVLVDEAADLLLVAIPEPNASAKRIALIEGEKDLFLVGLTTITDAGLDVSDIKLISELHLSGDLQIRVMAMASGTQSNLDSVFEMGPWRTDRIVAESIKFYMDGALGSRGAALIKPYSDRPNYNGYLIQDSTLYKESLFKAHELGFQVCTHGIGR